MMCLRCNPLYNRFPQKGDACPDANPFNPVNPEAEDEAWNGDPYPMNQ